MPTLNITVEDVYKLIEQLDLENKIAIFNQLKPQVLADRWEVLFNRIDERKKINLISFHPEM